MVRMLFFANMHKKLAVETGCEASFFSCTNSVYSVLCSYSLHTDKQKRPEKD